jgi:hypothetical protein
MRTARRPTRLSLDARLLAEAHGLPLARYRAF